MKLFIGLIIGMILGFVVGTYQGIQFVTNFGFDKLVMPAVSMSGSTMDMAKVNAQVREQFIAQKEKIKEDLKNQLAEYMKANIDKLFFSF